MSKINGIGIGVSYGNSSGSGNLIDSSTFFAPLKTSLILQRGTGNPTWSRATKAWGFNELGYLEELASGCAFFGGARLVRNTVRTTSEDFSNAAWTKSACTVTGTNTLVCANATSTQYINQGGTISLIPGQKLSYCIRAKKVVGGVDFIQISGQTTTHGTGQFCNISLIDGTYSATGCSPVVTPLGGGAYDITVVFTCVAAGFDVYNIVFANALSSTRLEAFVGDGVKSFELLRAWSVDVTGYDTSYIPEYVSVDVEASPYFGAGIDGAKYFNTGWNGAPLTCFGFRREAAATNNLLWNRDLRKINWLGSTYGSNLTVNSGFDADTDWTKRGTATIAAGVATCAAAAFVEQAITTVVGARYALSVTVSAASNRMIYKVGNVSASNAVFSDPAYRTTTGAQAAYFTATATTTYISFGSDASATGSAVFDDFTCTRCGISVSTVAGLDGIANTATTLTCYDANATILQPITLVSAARCASAYVKRRTGTGTISFTQDGGSTWTDITAQINSSTWSRVQITSTLANPSVGFKISTSGDEIDVDCVQNEAGVEATSPVVTTTAAVTRNADSLSYQFASNCAAADGTAYAELQSFWSSSANCRALGFGGNTFALGVGSGGASTSIQTYDGTTNIFANALSNMATGRRKRACAWTGATRKITGDGVAPTAGAYDGDMGTTNITIGADGSASNPWNGYVGHVAIYNYAMTDAELRAITL